MADDIIVKLSLDDTGLKKGFEDIAKVTSKFTLNIDKLVKVQKKLDAHQKKLNKQFQQDINIKKQLANATDKLSNATQKNAKEADKAAEKQKKLEQNAILFKKEVNQLRNRLAKLGMTFKDVGIKTETVEQALKGHTAQMAQVRKGVNLTDKEIKQQNDVLENNKQKYKSLMQQFKNLFINQKELKMSTDTLNKAQKGHGKSVQILEKRLKTLKEQTRTLSQSQRPLTTNLKNTTGAINKQARGASLLGTKHNRLTTSNEALSFSFATLRSRMLLLSFAFGLGIRQAVAFANTAAKLEGMERAFANLAGGTFVAKNMLGDLKEATDDTMSSFDLFQQANNAMILGVADNSTEMARLFDMAQRLGRALGRDTKMSVESLITGIGRQSRLMLDNVGIIVKAEDAYEAYANGIGVTTDKLTDNQKKQAFASAAIKAGEKALERLGPEVLGVTDAFGKFDAELQELSARIGDALIPAMKLLANAAADLMSILNEKTLKGLALFFGVTLVTAISASNKAMKAFVATTSIFAGVAMTKVVAATGAILGGLFLLDKAFGRQDDAIDETIEFYQLYTKELDENFLKISQMTESQYDSWYEGLKQKVRDAAKAEDDLGDSTDDLNHNFSNIMTTIKDVNLDEFINKIDKTNAKLELELLGKTTDVFTEMKKIFAMDLKDSDGFTSLIQQGDLLEMLTGNIGLFHTGLVFANDAQKEFQSSMMEAFDSGVITNNEQLLEVLQKTTEHYKTHGTLLDFNAIKGIAHNVNLKKSLDDINNSQKNNIETLEESVEVLGTSDNETLKLIAAYELLNETYNSSDMAQEEFLDSMIQIARVMALNGELTPAQIEALILLEEQYADLTLGIDNNTGSLDANIDKFKEFATVASQNLRFVGDIANSFGDLAELNGKSQKEVAQYQYLGAIANTAAAAAQVLADPKLGFVGKTLAMTSVLASGAVQIATIKDSLSKMGGTSGGGDNAPPVLSFEQGGYVGGNRHSQGGTIIEAERGEFVMSRNAVESIGLETLNQMNQGGGGGSINVSVTGNVLTQDFVEGELAESIKEAVRRGSDFGIG